MAASRTLIAAFVCALTLVSWGERDARFATPPRPDALVPSVSALGLPGTWLPIAGSHCSAMVAVDPSTSVPALRFEPCPSAPARCRALVVDEPFDAGKSAERVRLVRGTAYLAYAREHASTEPTGSRTRVHVVQPLEGAPVFAVATRSGAPECALEAHVGDWGFALSQVPFEGARGAATIGWAPWTAPSTARFSNVSLSWEGAPPWMGAVDLRDIAVGTRALFLHSELWLRGPVRGAESASVQMFDPSVGALVASSRRSAKGPLPAGDGAVALHEGDEGRSEIVFIDARGATSRLRKPAPSYAVTCLAVDRAGGADTLVWVERARDSTWLFASLLGKSSNAVRPRRAVQLTAVDGHDGCAIVANGGHVLGLEGAEIARVTRLSDGRAWRLRAEPGARFEAPLWIDDIEAWLATDGGIVRLALEGAPAID